jgi:hypothetical protein
MPSPCSCAGSNENCRYCFGSGFVTSPDEARNAHRKVTGKGRPNGPPARSPIAEQHTHPIGDNHLQGHWSRMILDNSARDSRAPEFPRGDRQIRQSAPAPPTPAKEKTASGSGKKPGRKVGKPNPSSSPKKVSSPTGLTRCDLCNMGVYPSHLQLHMYKKHGIGMPPAKPVRQRAPTPQAVPRVLSSRPDDMAACPFCRAFVRDKNLPKHFKKVHPGIPAPARGSANAEMNRPRWGKGMQEIPKRPHTARAAANGGNSEPETRNYAEERRLQESGSE